jgi:hypothetical protein
MSGKKTFEKIKKYIESFSPWIKTWNSATALFSPKKIDETINDAIKLSSMGLALKVFVLASLIATSLTLLGVVEIVYIVNFTSETITEAFGTQQQMMSFGEVVPLMIFHIITGIPLALFTNIGGEWFAYRIAKATGGKGKVVEHLYLISIVTLSLSFVNLVAFILPIPCIQLIGFVASIAVMAYLWGYVASKVYMKVHGITFVHALTIIIVVSIIRFAIMITVVNWLSGTLDLSTLVNYQIGV